MYIIINLNKFTNMFKINELRFGLAALYFICAINCIGQNSPNWLHFDSKIFEKAKKDNKLVLLHLRANWCHWCHVMEEKTYTDPVVLKYLSSNYLTCMEDHDERQDLTSLYSEYGWPATIIFDCYGNEIYKEAGYIESIEFIESLKQLKANPVPLQSNIISYKKDDNKIDTSVSSGAIKELQRMFKNSLDIDLGGFVFGQKYVEFATFEYALSNYKTNSDIEKWLTASIVNSKGINDTVWGGVFQYSTHNDWDHVHFEKLLSIQARYIKMYCWYYQLFKNEEVLKRAENIVKYVDRFLTSPKGCYYNAQDADLIPGQKSKDYFSLNDAERLKKGIPAVDTNVYTNENAAYAESLMILWATTGNKIHLDKALNCIDVLEETRLVRNLYKHGARYTSTVSLNDNLAILKTLMFAYRATGIEKYKTEAAVLINEINTLFNSGNGYFYSYVGESAIKPTYNVSENIEACRLLNYSSSFFHDVRYKKAADELLVFLTSEALVNTIATEPGILSAVDELKSEPINAAFMLKTNDAFKDEYVKSTIAIPCFYFNSLVYTKETVVADKKDLFDAFDNNFAVLCTSSYCSSPMSSIKEFEAFLYSRVLGIN